MADAAEDYAAMLKILEPQEFKIATAISHVLNVVLICFTFSPGIPIFLPICMVFLVLIFFIEKYKFLNSFDQFPIYSRKIIYLCYWMLVLIFLLHNIMAIYTLGSTELFMKETSNLLFQIDPNSIDLSDPVISFLLLNYIFQMSFIDHV